jgi:glycogen debranching enzyme
VSDASVTSGTYHIVAASGPADARTHVLKHADTFAVFDHYGDIGSGGLGEEGLYHLGTRHLSAFLLALDNARPFLLHSGVGTDGDRLAVALTNPDHLVDGQLQTALGTLHLTVNRFLWRATLYQDIQVTNYGLTPKSVSLAWHVRADYADIFEVRGLARNRRGTDLGPVVTHDSVTLAYKGLDGVIRRTVLRFEPAPDALSASLVRYDLGLAPQQTVTLTATIACELGDAPARALCLVDADREAQASVERGKLSETWVQTSNPQVDAWIARAFSDLRLLTTELPTGPYPYAGIPWFNTPFGRDGIITAFESLWCYPEIARGVLGYLASTQATRVIPDEDAEPGKILHETRNGEMAALKEMPFGRYYGSVDGTPLFIVLAGAYYERTGDLGFVETLWPAVDAALGWIDRYGDLDGDGFTEYRRRSTGGLIHQGWKDADDAIVHEDGTIAEGAIAVCEVQGYVYAARRAAAALATARQDHQRAASLLTAADTLRARFESAFWCDDLGTYALALDGEKQPCRVRASNAGHALFAGIASRERAAEVAKTLFEPDLFSGWGIRTLGAREARFNPLGYHTGTVWPHDNALVGYGLAAYGFRAEAGRLLEAMFDASLTFDGQRMPELFCGFRREPTQPPVPYPLACSPQAWASGAVLLLLKACLGLRVDGRHSRILLADPYLPSHLREVSIRRLPVADGFVDLSIFRHGRTVGVNVLDRDGPVEVLLQ